MDKKAQEATLDFLFKASKSEWDILPALLETLGDNSYQVATDFLSNLSFEAAALSEYLGYRGSYGCGDHGHEEALGEAKKKRKKVRKALGYVYP